MYQQIYVAPNLDDIGSSSGYDMEAEINLTATTVSPSVERAWQVLERYQASEYMKPAPETQHRTLVSMIIALVR